MTWIKEIKKHVREQYNLYPRITENYHLRYKKFCHRATLTIKSQERHLTGNSSYVIDHKLKKTYGDSIRVRNEWGGTFVYFNDLDQFLLNLPGDVKSYLTKLEVMNPDAVSTIKNFKHEYPVDLKVTTRLPLKKYRYRVYITSSGKVRKSIGEENLSAICNVLSKYDGLELPSSFKIYAANPRYIPSVYFYATTLDWLPIIYLMDPKFINRIEHFKTKEEINNEPTTDQSAIGKESNPC